MFTVRSKARQPAGLDGRKIDEALEALRLAQEELTVAVNELVPMGDKRMITAALQRSFEKVRTAQNLVLELQQLLARV